MIVSIHRSLGPSSPLFKYFDKRLLKKKENLSFIQEKKKRQPTEVPRLHSSRFVNQKVLKAAKLMQIFIVVGHVVRHYLQFLSLGL